MNWYETWLKWPVLFLAGYGINSLIKDVAIIISNWLELQEMERDRRRDGFR